MADSFQLSGSYVTNPLVPGTTGTASICASIAETLSLTRKDFDSILLDVDTPIPASFASGVTAAAVVIAKATGGKVRMRITSADGALQSVPVDSLAVIFAGSVPITAIDFTRVPGTQTTVDLFLGQTT